MYVSNKIKKIYPPLLRNYQLKSSNTAKWSQPIMRTNERALITLLYTNTGRQT